MDGEREIDADRVLDLLRRRVLDPDETATTAICAQTWLTVDTARRSFAVSRPSWLLLAEPWLDDAVLAVWDDRSLGRGAGRCYGLVFARDGAEYLLLGEGDDLAELGRRLGEGLDPCAFAELLALFHTGWYVRGQVVTDPALLLTRFPELAPAPGLRPPHWQRTDHAITLDFLSYTRSAGASGAHLVLREWIVQAPADGPATWVSRAVAQFRLR